jgi:DNA-binding transcriptional MerR regulator
LVWLLNLIPYLGAGYLYATGFQGMRLMIFVWAFELAFGSPAHLVWIYFILSILGSAQLMNKDRASAIRLRQMYFKGDVKPVAPGQQASIGTGIGHADNVSKTTEIAQAAKDLNVTSVTIRRYLTEFNIETTSDENGSEVLPDQAMEELKEISILKDDDLANPKILEILEHYRDKRKNAKFSLPTLDDKARRSESLLSRMTAHEDDKSKHALEAFEYKALAAEKTLQARASQSERDDSDSSVNFAPPDAPKFSDEQPNIDNDFLSAPSTVPKFASPVSAGLTASATPAGSATSDALSISAGSAASATSTGTMTSEGSAASATSTGFMTSAGSVASPASTKPMTSAGSMTSSAAANLAASNLDSANLAAKNTSEMSDYISNINTGFSMDSEIAKIDSFVNLGASSGSQEVQNLLNQDAASNASDLKLAQAGSSLSSSTSDEASVMNLLKKEDQSTAQAEAPSLVPEIASQIASSDSLVPDVTTQYNSDPLSLPSPELTLENVNKGVSAVPNVASPYATASNVPPESRSWSMKTNVPEVNTEYKTPDTSVPEVSTQWGDSGTSVPEVNSMLQSSDAGVTDADSQWQNALTSVPEVNSQWQNPNTSVPEVSSQWQNVDTSVPEVNSQWQNSNTSVPDVSSQWQNVNANVPDISAETAKSDSNVPDIYSELTKSDQAVPNLSSELTKSDQSVPEVSSQITPTSSTFGNFESPKFSFSFDDHISGSAFGSATSAQKAIAEPHCAKCGDEKNPNFSFCLACGQSFS